MSVTPPFDHGGDVSEDVGELLRRIALHGKPAAAFWTVICEGADNHMSVWPDGRGDFAGVCSAVVGLDEKMKYSAIVPNVHGTYVPIARDICRNPLYGLGRLADSLLGAPERVRGDIEYRHAAVPTSDQRIDEAGIPASYIEDSSRRRCAGPRQQIQRRRRPFLEPAQLIAGASGVDRLPVLSSVEHHF